MTVGELIALLQQYPQDAVIHTYAGGNDGYYQLKTWGTELFIGPANVVGYREGEQADTPGIVICEISALDPYFNFDEELRYKLTVEQQKRVKDGHSVPTPKFDERGDRIYIHYPYISPIGMHGEMRCSWRMFEATWAGES